MHESVRLLRPLALLLFLSPACGRGSAEPQGASVPASAPASAAAPPRAVIRGFVMAAPETIRLSPDLHSEHWMEPTVDYPSFEIARDSIGAITRRSVKPNQRTVRLSGGPARFKYLFAADSVDGWAFHVTVADTSECPDSRIEDALQAAGWAWADGYSADGTDGSVMGFVTKTVPVRGRGSMGRRRRFRLDLRSGAGMRGHGHLCAETERRRAEVVGGGATG